MRKLITLLLLLPFYVFAQQGPVKTKQADTTSAGFQPKSNSLSLSALQTKFNLYTPVSTTVAGFPLSGNVTLATHIPGFGLSGSNYLGSASQTWIIDSTVVRSVANSYTLSALQTKFNLYPLKTTTVAGFALSGNVTLATETYGIGLINGTYNGSTAATVKVDTAVIQTVLNFFPKGDTRYSLKAGSSSLTTIGTIGSSPYTTAGLIHNSVTTGAFTSSLIVNADITNSTIDLTTKVTGLLPDGNISSATNWNTAYNNRIQSFATTGNSGAGSWNAGTGALVIPNYTLAGLGGVPTTTTVAGFPLSGNVTLANLTATDATITFSGIYTGANVRTIGLNLSNANTWLANITAPTYLASASTAFSSSTTTATSNMSIYGTGAIGLTNSSLLIGTAAQVRFRAFMNGQSSTTISAGDSYIDFGIGKSPITMPSSGTTDWLAVSGALGFGTITNASAIPINNTAVGYFGAASSAGTNNYSGYFGGVIRADFGSDATGDIWYRNSANGGSMTRLGIGATGTVLKVVSGLPSWQPQLQYTHTIFTPTTGGTVSLNNNQYNIINPAGALLALTVNLPSSPANNDVVYIKFTQNVTTVTYANGTVQDGITAPTAGGLTVLTYDSGTSIWY